MSISIRERIFASIPKSAMNVYYYYEEFSFLKSVNFYTSHLEKGDSLLKGRDDNLNLSPIDDMDAEIKHASEQIQASLNKECLHTWIKSVSAIKIQRILNGVNTLMIGGVNDGYILLWGDFKVGFKELKALWEELNSDQPPIVLNHPYEDLSPSAF